MTLELESQRQTAEWFNNLKPSVKDMVCRIYNYIEVWKEKSDIIDFTPSGIQWACHTLSHTGLRGDKFVQRFYQNLDHIKNLVDNVPTKTVRYWYEWNAGSKRYNSHGFKCEEVEFGYCTWDVKTFKFYDQQKMGHEIHKNTRDWSTKFGPSYHKHEVIKSENTSK